MEVKRVVQGEAPESDEEWENKTVKNDTDSTVDAYGVIIEGEAPESDDENVSLSINPNPQLAKTLENNLNINRQCDSILQAKLSECNISFRRNLKNLVHNTALNATRQLLKTDQQLLKSQVVLQSALFQVETANENTKKVSNKLKSILESNFVPKIMTE